jgi:hypothetical protein
VSAQSNWKLQFKRQGAPSTLDGRHGGGRRATDCARIQKDEAIEANMGSLDNSDAGHADFWRISETREMFMIRGYVEDGRDIGRPDIKPRTTLDVTLPVWRIGEMLLFVERFAKALEVPDALVHVRCSWHGLENRRLVSVSGRRMVWDDRVSRASEIETMAAVPASQISARLPDVVRELTEPVYQLFDFFTPPSSLLGGIGPDEEREVLVGIAMAG